MKPFIVRFKIHPKQSFSHKRQCLLLASSFPSRKSNYSPFKLHVISLQFVCSWRVGIKSCDLLSWMRVLRVALELVNT